MVDPCHFERGELADLGIRVFGGGDGTFFLIEVDKHFHFVTDVHIVSHIALGQEDLALLAAVKIQAEIDLLDYSEDTVVSKGEHSSSGICGMIGVSMSPSRRWMVRSVMAASVSSWVTMTKVCPKRSRRSKKS